MDESTLPGNEALLLSYARFIKDNEVMQKLLFAKELETDTRGESIFTAVEQFFKEQDKPINRWCPHISRKIQGIFFLFKKGSTRHFYDTLCLVA